MLPCAPAPFVPLCRTATRPARALRVGTCLQAVTRRRCTLAQTSRQLAGNRTTLRSSHSLQLFFVSAAALTLLGGCHHAAEQRAGAAQHLDFNQDVQPILASRCFSCHGPDPEMRKAGLRLDLGESAMKKRPGHPDAIVPGHPEQSELVKRIESKDPHYLMPQSAQGEAKPMKAEEIATLKEWIKEGAVYRPHWAFEAPVRAAMPAKANDGWVKNPIDAFVLARMTKEGLKPSPEADKGMLIRRVTLDLTGLLPTPAEVEAFEHDTSPQAYEHLVDGLLARPTFGEQRARYKRGPCQQSIHQLLISLRRRVVLEGFD